MEGIEDGDAVEEDQVLVRRAAPHVEGGGEVGHGAHAGQHFHGPYGVGLNQPRQLLHRLAADLLDGHASGFLETDADAAPFRPDLEPLEFDRPRRQLDLEFERRRAGDLHLPPVPVVTEPGHREDVGAGPHPVEGEVPETVGADDAPQRRIGGGDEADVGVGEESALGGPDPAGDRRVLRGGGERHGQGEEDGGRKDYGTKPGRWPAG